ncbi:MAG: hypothetical protein EPO11_06035, partial [Gammaproteobacteria bacterium]
MAVFIFNSKDIEENLSLNDILKTTLRNIVDTENKIIIKCEDSTSDEYMGLLYSLIPNIFLVCRESELYQVIDKEKYMINDLTL